VRAKQVPNRALLILPPNAITHFVTTGIARPRATAVLPALLLPALLVAR